MPKSTNNTLSLADDNQTLTLDILDDDEFCRGFTDGLNAYNNEVEEYERPITTREACQTIRHELDPKIRQNERVVCAHYGWAPPSQIYTVGFLAGWIAAHTKTLAFLST